MSFLREVELRYRLHQVDDEVIGGQATDAATIYRLFSDLQCETREKLVLINLDSRCRILCFEVLAVGSALGATLRPMDVFRTPIVFGAHAAIMVHNHPSGDPSPSDTDIAFTRRVLKMARTMGLVFVDHVIIGAGTYYSFAEEGLLVKLAREHP